MAVGFPDDAKQAFDVMAERALTEGMGAVAEIALRRIFTAEYGVAHPDMLEERRRAIVRMDPEGFADGCRVIRDLDLSAEVAGITTPALIVVGSRDEATPPDYGRRLATMMPRAEYRELPGVAHGPQLETPEEFVAAIGPFLGIS